MRLSSHHNLHGNARESSPRECLFLDTETGILEEEEKQLLPLRYWCLQLQRRQGVRPTRARTERAQGRTAGELADQVDGFASGQHPVWLFAHNLSVELATTRLPLLLLERGWELGRHNLASEAPWAHLKRSGRSLWLVDSWSWLGAGMGTVGAAMGIAKPPLPDWDDSDAAWWARCWADVEILSAAMSELMDWWDRRALGNWSVSGPATGWNAMRHMCVRRRGQPAIVPRGPRNRIYLQHGDGHVVISSDPTVRAFERTALYGGRRQVWTVGAQPTGDYVELDIRQAHLTVAAELRTPCRRGIAFDSLPVDSRYIEHDNLGPIARVRLRTEVERYPLRARAGIVYPVGEFETTLAGPEIAEARRRGELLAIGPGHLYRLSYHLQPWALWLQALLEGLDSDLPPAAALTCKQWSRTVIGKWGARTSRTQDIGATPEQGWRYVRPLRGTDKLEPALLLMAGRMLRVHKDLEADDAFPAILAWVQSWTRVMLARVIDNLGPASVLQCNTDGLICDARRAGLTPMSMHHIPHGETPTLADLQSWADLLAEVCWPFALRAKGVYRRVEVISPQHLRMDGRRRLAGIPGAAKELAHNVFEFHTWPKMQGQMESGDERGYVRTRRKVDLAGIGVNRWVAECGCTAAVTAAVAPPGRTVVLAPGGAGCEAHAAPWRLTQWRGLPALTPALQQM